MPLDRPHKSGARLPYSFHKAVLGIGHRLETRSQLLDALMVAAVYREFLFSQAFLQRRIRDQFHRMYRLIVRGRLPMADRRWMLGGQVLVKTSSQGHIDQLQATADPQYRFVLFQHHRQKNSFHFVPLGAAFAALR